MNNLEHIRNFCIIAHIDHGKSTLADRMLEKTISIEKRDIKNQTLDSMDIEKERGITIKSTPVKLEYDSKNGNRYIMNLIDTPGHVDFSYEVSRSIAACEGAILIVDATKGIQAQTLANVFLAMEKDLTIIPVINKIDLAAADVDRVKKNMEEALAIPGEDCILCSAKTGEGVEDILEQIVAKIPAPKESNSSALQALIFDSIYNNYRGVIPYIRIMSGEIKKGDIIRMISTNEKFEILEVGTFNPDMQKQDSLKSGEVGYISANIRDPEKVNIGDTIVMRKDSVTLPLEGFSFIQPTVFSGLYPMDSAEFHILEDALEKLKLNDAALTMAKESSVALGFGFRCGFLGLLHLEVVAERLLREFGISVLTCTPSVVYLCDMKDGTEVEIKSPVFMPDRFHISKIKEPWVLSRIIFPSEYMGLVMSLSLEKRGVCVSTDSLDDQRVMVTYHFPMSEIITDFSDKLKSYTKGFASFDYTPLDYRVGDVVKMNILLNGEIVDAFTSIVHRSAAERRGRWLCDKLADLIPRSLIKVAIQASADNKIIARSTISALKKDVTAKCYGGDITRKYKLWNKQKEGKKKMRQFGQINVPHEVFIKIIKESAI